MIQRVYVFNNGLLRICSKRYRLDSNSVQDMYVHIDSYDINIHNKDPEKIAESIAHEGLRW